MALRPQPNNTTVISTSQLTGFEPAANNPSSGSRIQPDNSRAILFSQLDSLMPQRRNRKPIPTSERAGFGPAEDYPSFGFVPQPTGDLSKINWDDRYALQDMSQLIGGVAFGSASVPEVQIFNAVYRKSKKFQQMAGQRARFYHSISQDMKNPHKRDDLKRANRLKEAIEKAAGASLGPNFFRTAKHRKPIGLPWGAVKLPDEL